MHKRLSELMQRRTMCEAGRPDLILTIDSEIYQEAPIKWQAVCVTDHGHTFCTFRDCTPEVHIPRGCRPRGIDDMIN